MTDKTFINSLKLNKWSNYRWHKESYCNFLWNSCSIRDMHKIVCSIEWYSICHWWHNAHTERFSRSIQTSFLRNIVVLSTFKLFCHLIYYSQILVDLLNFHTYKYDCYYYYHSISYFHIIFIENIHTEIESCCCFFSFWANLPIDSFDLLSSNDCFDFKCILGIRGFGIIFGIE